MDVLLLFIAAIVLVYIELFVPGGIFGAMGLLAFVASIVLAFVRYDEMGFVIAFGEIAAAVVLLLIGLKRFPRSYAGRRIILGRSLDKKLGYSGTDSFDDLLGQEGVSVTALRPSGVALVNKRRVDVVSDGAFIEKGKKLKVVQVEGNRIVVREMA
ncbi:MAG: NfeD family protein [Candidatus Abyssubacteria bacterium]